MSFHFGADLQLKLNSAREKGAENKLAIGNGSILGFHNIENDKAVLSA